MVELVRILNELSNQRGGCYIFESVPLGIVVYAWEPPTCSRRQYTDATIVIINTVLRILLYYRYKSSVLEFDLAKPDNDLNLMLDLLDAVKDKIIKIQIMQKRLCEQARRDMMAEIDTEIINFIKIVKG